MAAAEPHIPDLTGALPAGPAAALDRMWTILPEARLVGGAVRDLLAGRKLVDLDL
ncbi:hypothetical protein HUK83_16500, partial [Endobacter medicaginis]|nr:hypothetical protein [Endobacter medicaginis]